MNPLDKGKEARATLRASAYAAPRTRPSRPARNAPKPMPEEGAPSAEVEMSSRKRAVLAMVLGIAVATAISAFACGGKQYWDGGEFAGRPVYSPREGISRAAHDHLEQCGMRDDDIRDVVIDVHSAGWAPPVTIYERKDGELHETAWLSVREISPWVYEVNCATAR